MTREIDVEGHQQGSVGFADPVMTELLRYEVLAASEEMLVTMRRTARSVLAREGADYGAAILDSRGEIVAQVVPYGFMYFQRAVPEIISKYRGHLYDGDVVVTNDPYGGASHLPDIIMVRPFYFDNALVGYTAVAQHHTDIGGRFPGGSGAASVSVFEEGLRLPAVKLYEKGKPVAPLLAVIEANVRAPDDVLGDLSAALASCIRGADSMTALLAKYGRNRIDSYFRYITHTSETYMRGLISSFPNGRHQSVVHFTDADVEADIAVSITVNGDEMTVDLAGTSAQLNLAMNVPFGMTAAMPVHAMLGFLGEVQGVNLNSGLMWPITVVAPEGSAANPTFPAAVGSRAQLYNRMVHAARECLAQFAPDVMPAPGEGCNGAIYVSPGADAKQPFRLLTEFYASGWGARPSKDGVDGVMAMMLSGFRTVSSEVAESETAVALDGFGFVRDTGGAGKYRGSLAVYRRWRFLDHARVLVRDTLPGAVHAGRNGGHASSPSRLTVISAGVEKVIKPRVLHDLQLAPGDVLEYALASAAGYGSPLERDTAKVLADVMDDKVSPEAARAIYGVALVIGAGGTFSVDHAETSRLRETRHAMISEAGEDRS
jgi:N-methylhydantoinase B